MLACQSVLAGARVQHHIFATLVYLARRDRPGGEERGSVTISRSALLFGLILVLGAVLRVYGLDGRSRWLWFDEFTIATDTSGLRTVNVSNEGRMLMQTLVNQNGGM